MCKVKLALWILVVVVSIAAASPPSSIAVVDPVPFTWFERGVQKRAWLSLDKLSVMPQGTVDPVRFPETVREMLERQVYVRMEFPHLLSLWLNRAMDREGIRSSVLRLRRLRGVKWASPVFYTSPDEDPDTRMLLDGNVLVQFPPTSTAADIHRVERQFSLMPVKVFPWSPTTIVYRVEGPMEAIEKARALFLSGMVREASPNWMRHMVPRAVPDDPLFQWQWHLHNTGQSGGTAGEDVDITPVWDTHLGSPEQVIAVVDEGVEVAHEDLSPNVIAGLSHDYVDGDEDPTGGSHGTSVAGVAAARGFNGIGVTGAAPQAGLIGYRLLGATTVANTADALSRNSDIVAIYNNSWGPPDGGYLLEAPPPEVMDAIRYGVATGRGGLGCIYVWAAGNGGDSDNSNYDGYANSRYVIAVSATTNYGDRAWYSEPGANILVNAPSSGGSLGITTTDRTGSSGYDPTDYTQSFGGTSSAAPLVSGIIALMLQANPSLSWRDVSHILIETARQNDPTDPGWEVNGAGFPVHYHYGFGRVDAAAAVDAAQGWTPCGTESYLQLRSRPRVPIPDADPAGVADEIHVDTSMRVEFVEVVFNAPDHTYWGDLEVTLTSPSGTESVLASPHVGNPAYRYENWRFGTVRHYGEDSQGTWTLRVRDLTASDTGTLKRWTLKIYGTKGDSIDPPMGTRGTAITLTGSGFGTKKGKAWIGPYGCKVVSWDDTRVDLLLRRKRRLIPGTYDLRLKLRGGRGEMGLPNAFTIMPPTITQVSPPSGRPGDTITIQGDFFGTRKGKVYLEYVKDGKTKKKRCRIAKGSWKMDPYSGLSTTRFAVPRLPPGTYTLSLLNRVGEDTATFTVIE